MSSAADFLALARLGTGALFLRRTLDALCRGLPNTCRGVAQVMECRRVDRLPDAAQAIDRGDSVADHVAFTFTLNVKLGLVSSITAHRTRYESPKIDRPPAAANAAAFSNSVNAASKTSLPK